MPSKRRKVNSYCKNESFEALFDRITELLLIIKPNLARTMEVNTSDLIKDLNAIAELAEAFTKARSSTKEADALKFVDRLDLEGVGLWNSATYLKGNGGTSKEVYAAVRYAGFRLIEAGLDAEPSEDALANILELSSKVGMSFADAESDLADEILTNAASYERSLSRISEGEDTSNAKNRARAFVTYYTSRMDAAWKQNNLDVASYMMRKIEDDQIDLLSSQDVQLVINKMMEIGRSIIKGERGGEKGTNEAERAVHCLKWMSRAFSMIDRGERGASSSPLRRMVLRGLARAYYLSSTIVPENLEKAEAALKEVFESLEQCGVKDSGEYQRLRWMSLAILKKRETTDEELLNVLLPLVDHVDLSEEMVQEALSEIRAVAKRHLDVITKSTERLLWRTLHDPEGHPVADKILLSLIMHIKSLSDQKAAIKTLQAAFSLVSDSESYELGRVPATACLTLLWQFGDQDYQRKNWSTAGDWYLLGTHDVFECISELVGSKCARKAALCHLQSGQYASATLLIERCPKHEAATLYLAFLAAAHQGDTDAAVHAIQSMIKAQDFDRKMLFLATDFAREAHNRPLLHSILEALLETLKNGEGNTDGEALTIIRCLVRLVTQMLEEPAANTKRLVPILQRHFETAIALASEAIKQKTKALVRKDISWLWRVAYNVAISGLGVWDDIVVTNSFDIARRMMEIGCEVSILEPEPDLYEHRVMASFAAISGRVFSVRDQPETHQKTSTMRKILMDISELQEYMKGTFLDRDNNEQLTQRLASVHHLTLVYQAELMAELNDWDGLLAKVQEVNKASLVSVTTMEAIADILWSHKGCPVPSEVIDIREGATNLIMKVLFGCLETILNSTTQRGAMSIKRFSRWLRAVCSILLSRGHGVDRNKALAYMHQAVDVLRDHADLEKEASEAHYPKDERSWLISTSFNTGVECAAALQVQEAQQWFEVASMLCGFVSDSPRERIESAYRELLCRNGDPSM